MAKVGETVKVQFFEVPDQDAINTEVEASIKKVTDDLTKVQEDYITTKTIGKAFRSSLPIAHQTNKAVDYNGLEFGDHVIWDFGTGETHAPPVESPRWLFVEMIRTFPYPPEGSLIDNAIQRAWGYDEGFLATRSRYRNKWSEWRVMEVIASDIKPDLPTEPEPLTE